jgi:hypothetical protein
VIELSSAALGSDFALRANAAVGSLLGGPSASGVQAAISTPAASASARGIPGPFIWPPRRRLVGKHNRRVTWSAARRSWILRGVSSWPGSRRRGGGEDP